MTESYVSFSNKPVIEEAPSLAYTLGIGPCARWRTMHSGTLLTYEENTPEPIMVHVAVKKRTGIIEAPEKQTGFAGRLAFGTV